MPRDKRTPEELEGLVKSWVNVLCHEAELPMYESVGEVNAPFLAALSVLVSIESRGKLRLHKMSWQQLEQFESTGLQGSARYFIVAPTEADLSGETLPSSARGFLLEPSSGYLEKLTRKAC
jgi:hypothetical protein